MRGYDVIASPPGADAAISMIALVKFTGKRKKHYRAGFSNLRRQTRLVLSHPWK